MAVPYHTHKFEIPTASKADVAAGTRDDVVATPLALGSAATKDIGYFATAAQGAMAATAVQSINGKQGRTIVLDKADLGLGNIDNSRDQDKPLSQATRTALETKVDRQELGGAAYAQVASFASAAQGMKADRAVQTGDARLLPPGGGAGAVLVKSGPGDYALQWAAVPALTAVSYGVQALNAAQQAQARANIGAAGSPNGNEGQYMRGDGTLATLTAESVGLGRVENVADDDKPISKAVKNALAGKVDTKGGSVSGPISATIAGNGPMGLRLLSGTSNSAEGQHNFSPLLRLQIPRGGTGDPVGAFADLFYEEKIGEGNSLTIRVNGFSQEHHWWFRQDGSFNATGPINGAAKNFEIDHTVMSATHRLRHCSTESDELTLMYRGQAKLIKGRAIVNVEEYRGVVPSTYKKLWADAWVTALLNLDSFARLRCSKIVDASFEIISENDDSNDLVAWLVTARRNDFYVRSQDSKFTDQDGKLIVEFKK